MAVYTVFEPPQRSGSAAEHTPAERAERFAFVRDGFSWGAFLLGPVWMIYRRLWLVLVLYLALTTLVQVGLSFAGVDTAGQIVVAFLIALLIGFEGSSLRRFTLVRRRWDELGTVIADGLDAAERRFFDAWVQHERTPFSSTPGAPATPVTVPRSSTHPSPIRRDVIGLFPEPGSNR